MKGQSKPTTDETEKSGQKLPLVESPAKTSSGAEVDAAAAAAAEKARKEETPKSTASSDSGVSQSHASDSVKPPPTGSSPADSSGGKQDLSTDADSGKKPAIEKSPDESASEEKSETGAKSAGEIRQSLSSSTTAEDPKLKNPADQAIARDTGGDTTESGEAESGETGEGDEAGDGGSWGWGWGSSLLNAATNSIETFSSQVGKLRTDRCIHTYSH